MMKFSFSQAIIKHMTNDHSYITEISFHFFFLEGVDYGKDFNSYLCEHNKIFVSRS